MQAERRTSILRQWLGMAILTVVILVGGVMLEITSDGDKEEWYIDAWMVLGIAALASHLVLVSLPRVRLERAHRELEQRHAQQCTILEKSLEEMRHGDLVEFLGAVDQLPEVMSEAVQAAAQAISALVQQIQASSVEVATSAGTVHATSAELVEGQPRFKPQ